MFIGRDLEEPIEKGLESGKVVEYDNTRPFDEKARWIVTCNFDAFRIYDRARLFQTLDTPPADRDPYLEPELAIFPYTNGGLFRSHTETMPAALNAEGTEIGRRGEEDSTFSSEAVRRPLPLSASSSASPRLSKLRVKNGCQEIVATAEAILSARALYPDSSLADLYDPLTMPPELRAAHLANDRAVLAAYGLSTSATEREIVAHLFRLYAERCAIMCGDKTKGSS